MLVNPYPIPLVVTITNGTNTTDIMIPAKGRTSISVGYRLSKKDKQKYPKLIDTDEGKTIAPVAKKIEQPVQENKPTPNQEIPVEKPVVVKEVVEESTIQDAPEVVETSVEESATETSPETTDTPAAENSVSGSSGKDSTLKLSTRKNR